MNNPTPITDSIMSNLLGSNAKVFSWAQRNPNIFLSAGAATLLAPLFLKNDERGYVNTALITTPLITAAALVAPRVIPSFMREKTNVVNFAKSIPISYGFNTSSANSVVSETGEVNIEELLKNQKNMDPATFNRRYSQWLADAPVREATKRELEQEYQAARKGFTKLYSNKAKQRLLSNAIYHTDLKYSSTAKKINTETFGLKSEVSENTPSYPFSSEYERWLDEASAREEVDQAMAKGTVGGKSYLNLKANRVFINEKINRTDTSLPKIAPDYNDILGLARIEANKDNPNWLREFNFRLGQAQKIIVPDEETFFGGVLSAALKGTTLEVNKAINPLISPEFISYKRGLKQFAQEYPNAAPLLIQGVNKKDFTGGIEFETHPGLFTPTAEDLADLEKIAGGKTAFYHANKTTWRGPNSNRPLNPIVGIRFNKDWVLPLPQADNTVYMGSNFLQKGVSKGVIEETAEGFRYMSSTEEVLRILFSKGEEEAKARTGKLHHWLGRDKVLAGVLPPGIIDHVDPLAAAAISYQVEMSEVPGAFIGEEDKRKAWSELTPKEMVAKTRQLAEEGMQKFTSGTSLGTMEMPAAVNFSAMGTGPSTTENLAYKAFKRGPHTIVDPGKEALIVNDFTHPNGLKMNIPRVMMENYQVPQAQAAFFSELPEWKVLSQGFSSKLRGKDRLTAINTALDKLGARKRMITHMSTFAEVDFATGEQMFNKFLPKLSNRSSYETLRKLSYLGDTTRIGSDKIGASYFEDIGLTLSETDITPDMVGKSIPKGGLIGFHLSTPRTAEGEENVITSVVKDAISGETSINLRRIGPLQSVKGIDDVKFKFGAILERKQNKEIIRGLNWFNIVTGEGGSIPETTTGFVLEEKGLLAAKDPIEAQINQTARMLQRVQVANEGVLPDFITKKYLPKLDSFGLSYNPAEQRLHLNPAVYPETDVLRRRNMSEANDVIRQMFKDVGDRIKEGKIKADSFHNSWRGWSAMHPDRSFQEYTASRNYTTSTAFVDNFAFNHATRVKFTHDAASMLQGMGLHEIAKEIQNRSVTEGNLGQATEYLKHTEDLLVKPLDKKGSWGFNFSKPFGEVVNLEDILGDLDASLSTPEGRSGTIFDPDRMKGNYSVRVKVPGKEDVFLPHVGHDAYKGGVDQYGIANYASSQDEKDWRTVLTSAAEGEDFLPAATTYTHKKRAVLGLGKGSVYRPDLYDPIAVSGRYTPRVSTWKNAETGDVIGHEMGLAKNLVEELPREMRNNLLSGGHYFSVGNRYPLNKSVITRVVYDKNLGENEIGSSLQTAQMQRADFDGDTLQLHLMQKKKHNDAAEKYILDPNSEQSIYAEETDLLSGSDMEIIPSGGRTSKRYRPTPEVIAEKIGKANAEIPVEGFTSRTAGAGVGVSDNLGTALKTLLRESISIPEGIKPRLETSLFEGLTQSVIKRQKAVGKSSYDFAQLMGDTRKLKSALGKKTGEEDFIQALRKNLSIFANKEGVNPAEEHFNALEGYFRQLHSSYNSDAMEAARLMTVSGANKINYQGPIVPTIEGHFTTQATLANRGSSGATIAAETAGELNSGIRATAGKVKSAATGFVDTTLRSAENVIKEGRGKGAGKVLGIGLGIAAGAGILFSSIHSPREGSLLAPVPSGNSHRPEERLGVDGEVPGEPIEGSMSPGNPPRVVHQPPRGIRTSVVAPMGRDTDLEVTLRAESRERAAEVAKMTAKLAAQGGVSSTTINYRDSTRLKSLRTRQKIKDAMDSE